MPSVNITALTNLATPVPTMLMYAGLSPFGVTDDRKITANALFATITANISDVSVQFDNGAATATVSAAGKGKLRYNDTTKTFQASVDGGAYVSLGAGGGMAIGGAVAGGTTGSVLFIGAGPVLAQDNANLFWDDANNRLGIGTAAPTVPLEFSATLQNKINLLLGSTIGLGVQSGRFEIFSTGGAPIFLGQGPGGGMTDWLQVGAAIVRSNLVFGVNCNPQLSFVPFVSFGVIALGTNNVTEFLQSASGATVDQVNWLNISTNTNTVANQATFFTRSSGSAATGFGASFTWALESTTTDDRNAAQLQVLWTDATDATRTADIVFQNVNSAAALAETFRIRANGFYTYLGAKRVSTQFDKTDTTLANITGLSVNVAAGRTYSFEAILYTTSNVAGGVKFSIAGTATATAVIFEAIVDNAATVAAQTRATSLGTAVGAVTAVTVAYCRITGTITVNAAGTLTVQFAENAATGTSSVLVGSTFIVNEIT